MRGSKCRKGFSRCRGFNCSRGLWFGFMITCFIGWFNDMLIAENGKSILFRGSKQNHKGRLRHAIH